MATEAEKSKARSARTTARLREAETTTLQPRQYTRWQAPKGALEKYKARQKLTMKQAEGDKLTSTQAIFLGTRVTSRELIAGAKENEKANFAMQNRFAHLKLHQNASLGKQLFDSGAFALGLEGAGDDISADDDVANLRGMTKILDGSIETLGLASDILACADFKLDNAIELLAQMLGASSKDAVKEMVPGLAASIAVFIALSDYGTAKTASNPLLGFDRELLIVHGTNAGEMTANSSNSPKTLKYLKSRALKKGAAKLSHGVLTEVGVSAAGGWFSAAHHALAAQSSGVHKVSLDKLVACTNGIAGHTQLAGFVAMLHHAKTTKILTRGAETASSILSAVDPTTLASKFVKAGTGTVKAGRNFALKPAVSKICQVVHYLAQRELMVYKNSFGMCSSDLNPTNVPISMPYSHSLRTPAAELFRSICWKDMYYTLNGMVTKMPGGYRVQYDIEAIIKEPAGWMVMADKAMLD
jgi:hypothetical protein